MNHDPRKFRDKREGIKREDSGAWKWMKIKCFLNKEVGKVVFSHGK